MSGWNEDNFLENIMPLLRQNTVLDPCPKTEIISSVSDGSLRAGASAAVHAHIARCPACKQLQQRLVTFDRTVPKNNEAEWQATERRLDRWMDDFLVAGSSVKQGNNRKPDSWQARISEAFYLVPLRWAIGAAAALLVLGETGYLLSRFGTTPSVQMVEHPTVSQGRAAEVPPEQDWVAKRATEDRPPTQAADGAAQPKESVFAKVNPTGEDAHGSPPGEASTTLPHNLAAPVQAPTLAQAQSPSLAELLPTPASASPSVQSTGSSQTISPPRVDGAGKAVAMPHGRGITGNGVGPLSRSIARSPGAIASLPVRTMRDDLPTNSVGGSRKLANSNAPASVQLDAGTRLWISVKWLAPLPTGNFEFRGNLLLPVENAGIVLLERDTGIRGTGKRNNGRISLRVDELTIGGTDYELKNENNAMNAETSGRGGVVEFSVGQVFEMFMSSRAAYAK